MKNNKNFQFFDSLKTSDKLKQKILDRTIYNTSETKIKNKKSYKLAYTFCMTIIVSLLTCTMVFAASYIRTFFINKSVDENGWHKQSFAVEQPAITDDIYSFECKKGMKLEEVEKNLGIDFINNKQHNNIIDSCEIKTTTEGKIESISLDIYEYVDYSDENNKIDGYDSNRENLEGYNRGKHISLNISLMTSNASAEVKEIFSNLNEVGSDNEIYGKEIELESLNTTAYYYCPFGSRNGRCKLYTFVVIVHDNVIYTFDTQGVSLDKILEEIK